MQAKQPKLDLELAIAAAVGDPGAANLQVLLKALEQLIAELPQELQLKVAGEILDKLADVYASRAHLLLSEWEDKYNPVQSEPVLTVADLKDVLRQSMALNLGDVLEGLPPHSAPTEPADVMIGPLEKAQLLEFVAQLEQEQAKQDALAVAHTEDISHWIQAIAQGVQQHGQDISLLELQQRLKMPLVEIWLGLLLGGYSLEQRGDFYQAAGIWVCYTLS